MTPDEEVDEQLADEIDLLGRLVAASNTVELPLPSDQLDELLGLR